MIKLDKPDKHILSILQQDAMISMDALSDKVNLSRNACWRRVKLMEANGVILGRVALVNPEAVNLGLSVFVSIRTNSHDPDWLAKFAIAVQTLPEIIGAHRLSGELDYLLRVRVASMKDYDRFYKRLIKQIQITEISASFVMDDIKDTTGLPLMD